MTYILVPRCEEESSESGGLARGAGGGIVNDLSDWGYESSHSVWKPHMCAPGDWIYSAGLGGTYISKPRTSMAAPVVAGSAAFLVQRMRPARPNVGQLHAKLCQLVDPTQNRQWRNVDAVGNSRVGAGRLDLSGN